MAKRRVAVVTGTRAEYGLLTPVIKAIDQQSRLELQLFVTGMHLLKRFGHTVDLIKKDNWPITSVVPLQDENDDVIGQSCGLGRAITKFSEDFFRHKTDIVLVLGDRIEIFAAAAAAAASGRILAHIHGGDIAPGVQDDAWRFAITQLAHLHFTATKDAARRIALSGEPDFRIYQTGSPSLDAVNEIMCQDQGRLNEVLDFNVCDDYLLVIQHPAGGSARQERLWMRQTLDACDKFDMPMVVIYPNCDPGFSGIIEAARIFCRDNNCVLLQNLPRDIYLGLLQRCRVLVGNSSSGIIEAGYLTVPCVNIGPRQTGRERGKNVIDTPYGTQAVARGVKKALARKGIKPCRIYGNGQSSKTIARILVRVALNQRLRQKRKFL